jgi:hypothetical protein
MAARSAEKRDDETAAPVVKMKSSKRTRERAASRDNEKALPEEESLKWAMIAESGAGAKTAREHFVLNGAVVPRIAETDTSVPEDTLRLNIQRWKAYIEENPGDSLSLHGYEQVALAYYLLSRRTRDEAVMAEASRTVMEYIERAEDPAMREMLLDVLHKIEALRER